MNRKEFNEYARKEYEKKVAVGMIALTLTFVIPLVLVSLITLVFL